MLEKLFIGLLLLLMVNGNIYAEDDYVHYRLGVKYKNENRFVQAIDEFKQVLAAYPDNYNTYKHIADIRIKQGKNRLAIYNLKKALAYNPGWSVAEKMLGKVYFDDGQYQAAIEEYQNYLQYCDPAEKDSIQAVIDKTVKAMKKLAGKKPKDDNANSLSSDTVFSKDVKNKNSSAEPSKAEGKSSDVATKNSAKVKKNNSSSRNKSVARSTKNKLNPAVETEFRLAIKEYTEAASTGNQKLFSSSLKHLKNVLSSNPGHPGAYYYAALIRRRQGKNEMARINFEKALNYPELGYNAHFYLGKIYGESGMYEKAIKHLTAYMEKTDYEPGKKDAKKLIDIYTSKYKEAHKDSIPRIDINKLAKRELHKEISEIPPEKAFGSIEIRIDSLLSLEIVDTTTDPGQMMIEAINDFRNKKFDSAIDKFKSILLKYPKGDIAAKSVYDMGICYMKLNNFSAAETKFRQLVANYPSNKLASNSLFLEALSLSERKESRSAEKLYRKFILSNRKHKWIGKAYEKLGDCYVDLMENSRAVDAYNGAVLNSSGNTDKVYALFKLGNVYLKMGNYSRAVKNFKSAIELGNKNGIGKRVPDSYYKIADLYYKQKKYSDALSYYVKVVRKFPNYSDTPWGMFQIGSCYKNLKRYDEAVSTFNSLISKFPDDYWARQAKLKLKDTVWENEYRSVLK